MNIRLATDTDKERWNNYVIKHQHAHPYFLYDWGAAVKAGYGHRCYYLLAEEDKSIVGILPLIHMKLPLLSNQLISLPFSDLGGPLANNQEVVLSLTNEAFKTAKQLGAKVLELRTREVKVDPTLLNSTCQIKSDKASMLLQLPTGSQKLWESFKSKLRSQIRKAEKNSLTFEWGDLSRLNEFYNVFSKNMRDLGSPVHSKKWFHSVLHAYGANAKIGLVFKEKVPAGCGIILTAGKKACIPWASTVRELNRFSPNMLLYWKFMEHLADNDYEEFDFGRSTPNEGTYKFKAQWGASPRQLHWHCYNLKNSLNKKAKSQAVNPKGKRQVLENIWRQLPVPIANIVGPTLRKHISL